VNGGALIRVSKPLLLKHEWQIGSTASLHIGDPASSHAVWRFKW
jgi:hypothetical protein